MAYAFLIDDEATEIVPGVPFVDGYGVQHPGNTTELWSEAELDVIGVRPIHDDLVPSGKIPTGSRLEVVDGLVRRRWTLVDTPPPPIPEEISDRQFFEALALMGLITEAEALAAVKTGEIPAAMQVAIEGLPPEQRFPVEMIVSGATIFHRSNPLTNQLGQSLGKNPAEIDTLWHFASNL